MSLLSRLRGRWSGKPGRGTDEPAPVPAPPPGRDAEKDLLWAIWRLTSLNRQPGVVEAAAATLHQRGWTPSDYQQAFEAALGSQATATTRDLAVAVVDLAVAPGMTPERTVLALRAGLTPADVHAADSAAGIDWDGICAMAALRGNGSTP